jgi:hypothetical protein
MTAAFASLKRRERKLSGHPAHLIFSLIGRIAGKWQKAIEFPVDARSSEELKAG